jgi:hypothetical protein
MAFEFADRITYSVETTAAVAGGPIQVTSATITF